MRIVGVLATFILLATAGAASAATLTVTTTADSDDGACTAARCSLRDAVAAAGPGDVVSVPASVSHYMVTGGLIQITKPMTIQGASADATVVDAQWRNRVFEITAAVGAGGTVTFQNITVSRGAGLGEGGCIRTRPSSGSLVLTDTAVTNCNIFITDDADGRDGGGGIYTQGGALTITSSKLTGNSVFASGNRAAFNGGGAIFYDPHDGGTLSITDSDVSGNSVTANDNPGGVNGGGAILNIHGAMAFLRTTFTGNSASVSRNQWDGTGNDGGGAILDDAGPTTLTDSTVSGNTVYAGDNSQGGNGGGGILAQAGAWTIIGSTISDNTATVSDGYDQEGGGGISSTMNRALTIVSSTISGNVANLANATGARSGGGGVLDAGQEESTYINTTIANNRTNVPVNTDNGGGGILFGRDALLTNMTVAGNASSAAAGGGLSIYFREVALQSSIIAANVAPSFANCATSGGGTSGYDFGEFDTEQSTDLVYGSRCSTISQGGDTYLQGNPRLGPLQANGGPTETMALLPGSPAIDALSAKDCTDLSNPPQKLTVDQRGFSRPDRAGGRCDLGAFESSAPKPPKSRARPTISGTPEKGRTLTAHRGRWTNSPTSFSHQWLRCDAHGRTCRPISGATGMHLRLTSTDVGHRIRVNERVSNGVGRDVTRMSAATKVVT